MSEDPLSLNNLLRAVTLDSGIASKTPKSHEHVKTLESFHNKQLSKIRDDRKRLDDFHSELRDKKTKLALIEKDFFTPTAISSDIISITSRQKIETEINELEGRITKLSSGETEADYFLRVGDILFSYTDAQERIATGEKPMESSMSKKGRVPANSVYSYFSAAATEETSACMADGARFEGIVPKKASVIENKIGFQRDKALELYLNALNPDSIQHENTVASSIAEGYGTCPICDTELLMNETFLDCVECGYRDCILVDSEKPSYKDPPREMSYYAYKKINHLNEWLAQFQAKESTEISPAILDMIKQELKKERITDMSKLKSSKLKEIIKKLKLNRCYDHVAHILNRLNGVSAPVLSREVEEKLRHMFREIQSSFVKHCPKKRNNFLSYSFVLYKFCELLELDEYLPCFPLLKSREKLYMQDKIWQKICEDMGWEFIRTV